MRPATLACALLLTVCSVPALAQAQPAAAGGARYSSSSTQFGALMADPAAKVVLEKHLPQLMERTDDLEQASGMTLKEMQEALKPFMPDLLTDKILAEIDQDLSKLPVQK